MSDQAWVEVAEPPSIEGGACLSGLARHAGSRHVKANPEVPYSADSDASDYAFLA